jgi:hypothetical protein
MYWNGRALANDLEMAIYSISDNDYQKFIPYYWDTPHKISKAIRSRVFYHMNETGKYEWNGTEMVAYIEGEE